MFPIVIFESGRRPENYSSGRLIVSARHLTGRTIPAAYKHARPAVRRPCGFVGN
jgi:hypothetical protein